MYRIWYWATIDREHNGRFIASIPDLGDLAASGDSDKDAVSQITNLAREHVQSVVSAGEPAPRRRHFTEMPSYLHSNEVGRTLIPVEVERSAAGATPPYHMSP